MRKILSVLTLSIIFACSSSYLATEESTLEQHEKISQDLVGPIDKSHLLQEPYLAWYEKNYSSYSPNQNSIDELRKDLNEHQIKGFVGTWCHDSQRETPRLFKILEKTNYALNNLTLIALDQSKKTPEQLEKGSDIQRTPTFIFYKDGIEIGRIVEHPRESLEKDMLKIISGQKYTHSYQDL